MYIPTPPSRRNEPFNISAWAIRNPVPVCLLFTLLTLAGLSAFPQLRINNTPDIDLPAVTVAAVDPGAGPTEIETRITRRIENAVAALGNVKHITSTVQEGASTTVVEFVLGTDIEGAVNDVRNRVAQIRPDLPAGMRDPAVTRIQAIGSAMLTYTVQAAGLSELRTSELVDDDIARALLLIPGVAAVDRIGGVDREVRVALHPDRLAALGVTAGQVNAQLRDLNVNLPAGRATLAGGEQTIRALGSTSSIEALRAASITLSSGRGARLSELAEITDGPADIRTRALLDGKPVVAFSVTRASGSSEVQVAQRVTAELDRLQTVNPGLRIDQVATTVAFVRAGYRAAAEAFVVGAVLAVLVVYGFLRNGWATAIVAAAIPLSLIPTFCLMQWLGYSLNNVTLLSVTLVVGVLVDDAIVEIENIVRHLRARPDLGAYQAALRGSAEIGMPVVATTAAILAVFVPVVFMPGIPGQFFRQFGLTVSFAVGFSLLVARLLTPMLSAYLLRMNVTDHFARSEVGTVTRVYTTVLRICLRHRLATVVGGGAFLILSVALLPLLPRDFISGSDRNRSILSIELTPGSTVDDTEATVQTAMRILHAQPEVTSVFAAIGTGGEGGKGMLLGAAGKMADPRTATLTINLTPREERRRSQQQFETAIRPMLEQLPGARLHFAADRTSGSRIQITLVGDHADALESAANTLERQMRTIPRLSGVRSSVSLTHPELQIVPRAERAAERGVSVAAIAATTRIATMGDTEQSLARFDLPQRQIPVRVMLTDDLRHDPALWGALQVEGRDGLVPLRLVADLRYAAGPSEIERLDRMRKVTVDAELNGMPLGEAVRLTEALPVMQALPDGVHEQATGDKEMMRELFSSFTVALASGVLLVYAVLVLLFGGFLQPLTILAALPLAVGGAFLTLIITHKPLGIAAVVGLLMLMGVVAKNAILLVEAAVRARNERGLSRDAAMIEAGSKRARAVVMTTVAMCAGMAHIALGLGADGEFRSPMALAVIGGLITSTLLSLVVVPAVYSYIDQVEGYLGGGRSRVGQMERGACKSVGA
jgi:hydrophobic/amphiphilic exporter-1 (mainly G- bacteria), HAE1 family